MAKGKKLKIEICDLDTVEAITDLFAELLTDFKAQAVAANACGDDIEYEMQQIDNKVEEYKQRLTNIFTNG